MKKKKNRKGESHHFVPQFYLRQWCTEGGRMWVYPTDGRAGFQASPGSFAAENGLYDTSDVPGMETIDTEGHLSEGESIFGSAWPEIFNGTRDGQTKMNLSRFLALIHLRHPHHKETARETNAVFRELAEWTKKRGKDRFEFVGPTGERSTVFVSDVEQYASDTPANAKAGFMRAMHTMIEDIAQVLQARRWGVLFSEAPVFVTSDCPLVLSRGLCQRENFGFRTPGTVITFPISPTKLLVIDDKWATDGLHYPLLSLGDANDNTVLAADRFTFSAVSLESSPETRS